MKEKSAFKSDRIMNFSHIYIMTQNMNVSSLMTAVLAVSRCKSL